MEKAIFLGTGQDLARFGGQQSAYSRLYFGSNCCPNLVPSAAEAERMCAFAEERKMGLTMVLPILSDETIPAARTALGKIEDYCKTAEVAFNDYGGLHLISEMGLRRVIPIHGLMLQRHNISPDMPEVIASMPKVSARRLLTSHISAKGYLEFLSEEYGVGRIEISNAPVQIDYDFSGKPVRASLHYPYTALAVSTVCIVRGSGEFRNRALEQGSCARECLAQDYSMTNRLVPKPLFLKGRCIIAENDNIPAESALEKKGIDRIVYYPRRVV